HLVINPVPQNLGRGYGSCRVLVLLIQTPLTHLLSCFVIFFKNHIGQFIKSVLNLDPPLLVYIIEGSVFAIITVVLYDKLLQKKKKRVEKELKE
ncbi:hypothetical protein DK853_31800, partial [Klebsiella oxytoca]